MTSLTDRATALQGLALDNEYARLVTLHRAGGQAEPRRPLQLEIEEAQQWIALLKHDGISE